MRPSWLDRRLKALFAAMIEGPPPDHLVALADQLDLAQREGCLETGCSAILVEPI